MQYKRSQILINKRFQLKFAFIVCSLIFVVSLIYPFIIYNIFEYFLKLLGENSTLNTPPLENIRKLQEQVLIVLGVVQVLFLALTFIVAMFLSHRIAGPLFKLNRAMEEASKGNIDQRIVFRKNDYFEELAETFNQMLQSLTTRFRK